MGKGLGCATITLAVHPHFREKITILQTFGTETVQVELQDGRLRLLPARWTSLDPAAVAEIDGKTVRFSLDSLRGLAEWIEARNRDSDRRKVDGFDKRQEKVVPDGAPRTAVVGTTAAHGESGGGADASERRRPAAVVEQAGPPRPRRGSRRRGSGRKRGKR
jgi:hypothetical protein